VKLAAGIKLCGGTIASLLAEIARASIPSLKVID